MWICTPIFLLKGNPVKVLRFFRELMSFLAIAVVFVAVLLLGVVGACAVTLYAIIAPRKALQMYKDILSC